MSHFEINAALANVLDLPRMTEKAVIVIEAGKYPVVRVTRVLMEIDDRSVNDVRRVTERYGLVKLGAGGTANGKGGGNE